MSTDLVRRDAPTLVRLDTEQIKFIANSNFVPTHYRGKLPEIMACIATGREMGIGDMEALRMIHVIDGSPSMAAELMVKRARMHGHSIQYEQGDGWAKAHGRRRDNGDTHTTEWTMERAQKMGLASKKNWQEQPQTMLLWRAASELCRLLFPDVLSGVIYTPDEAEMSPEDRVVVSLSGALPPSDTGPDDRGFERDIETSREAERRIAKAMAELERKGVIGGSVADGSFATALERLTALAPETDWVDTAVRTAKDMYGKELEDLTDPELDEISAQMGALADELEPA